MPNNNQTDPFVLESIINLFKQLAAGKGLAILITTHNAVFGYEADRAITLEDGRIVKEENLRREPGSGDGTGIHDPYLREAFVEVTG